MAYAIIPEKHKLSGVLCKDQARPILTGANLRETSTGGWELVGTDSYKLARIPLTIENDNGPDLTAGLISADALKAIEKTGAFTANGTVTPVTRSGAVAGPAFPREDLGQYPNPDNLVPDFEDESFTVGINVQYLLDLARALDAVGKHGAGVKITFITNKVEVGDGSTVNVPNAMRPMKVQALRAGPNDAVGVIMPIRTTA